MATVSRPPGRSVWTSRRGHYRPPRVFPNIGIPHSEWDADIKAISLEGLNLFGIHEKRGTLYWDGKEVVTRGFRLAPVERGLASMATGGRLVSTLDPTLEPEATTVRRLAHELHDSPPMSRSRLIGGRRVRASPRPPPCVGLPPRFLRGTQGRVADLP